MTDTDTDTATDIRAAIVAAIDGWVECDWTHLYVSDDEDDGAEDDGAEVHCEGGDATCAYCRDADAAAEGAGELGHEALAALDAGNLGLVAKLVREASRIEADYGDDPSWADARKLVADY